ncbi:Uncharacterized conserved protein YehS, DUF1456 family [Andreprevotia lacus DSM 23236]|jgi:uncharacterized protein YehS (DUF1456 family)|uniref:Uncharacterized conserved protein YehS, DUF1456 family n=1 Tax=Andreprevotia lacus DSM 23236 TaxID=1121001 RepID=A0A1W1XIJ3_9NEIS|nr:DUF1456 family protein [Andreprevotia lacus]SMC23793.1 Uncharacterized conserved protein YehS, DUF1456 family [Andreprevotia lacus DSM 23236]
MINNDILRSVRYMLDLSDTKLVEIIGLAGLSIQRESVDSFLKKPDEADFAECSDEVLAYFLDGLVVFRRGKDESRPAPAVSWPVSNNTILKKLRVAFELKEEDLHAILANAGFTVGKPELSALFRKEGQKNYRPCGDQLLRNFLKGLTLRLRP